MWGILPRAVWEGFKEEAAARSCVYLQGREPGKAPVTRLWKVGSLSVEAKCEAEGSVHPFRGAQDRPRSLEACVHSTPSSGGPAPASADVPPCPLAQGARSHLGSASW